MALSSAVSLDLIYSSSRMVTNQNIMIYSNYNLLLDLNYVETGLYEYHGCHGLKQVHIRALFLEHACHKDIGLVLFDIFYTPNVLL